jgi:hypothetical protein
VPWCEDCAKFWTPSSMKADGSCPTCGRVLPVASDAAASEAADPVVTSKNLKLRELAGEDAKTPWHFKLLMVLLGIYLGWRLVQLVGLAF